MKGAAAILIFSLSFLLLLFPFPLSISFHFFKTLSLSLVCVCVILYPLKKKLENVNEAKIDDYSNDFKRSSIQMAATTAPSYTHTHTHTHTHTLREGEGATSNRIKSQLEIKKIFQLLSLWHRKLPLNPPPIRRWRH